MTSLVFNENQRGRFLTVICLVVLETISSAIELHYAALPYRSIWRNIFSTACYLLRPLIMYCMLLIVVREDGKSKKYFMDFLFWEPQGS